jgi:phage I-like protein
LSPPEWVELIPAGDFSGRDGRGPYRLDIDAVLAAFAQAAVDLPVDYDHQTLDAEEKSGPVPVAGWIKELQARDGALWGRVEWTPRAADLIVNREYRYLSPVFRHDKQGRVLSLEGAGLTHYPNLFLTPVAHTKGDADMDLTPIAEALGVQGEADVATLAAHAARLKEAATRAPDPTQWVPMSQHKAVADQLAALQAEIAAEKAEAAVTAAMSAGKLAPAMKEWALDYAKRDPEGFAAFVAAAPVVVSAGTQTAAHSVASNADTLTEEDRIACQLLGISEADFAAHKKELCRDAG